MGLPSVDDECQRVTSRIGALPEPARVAIAVGAAQRLMDGYVSEPNEDRDSFIVGWGATLGLVWQVLTAPTVEVDSALRDRRREYYSSPYCHKLGNKALPGADESPAAAAIYALEAYCSQSAKAASSAALRLVEAADQAADRQTQAAGEDLMSAEADERRDSFAQEELHRLAARGASGRFSSGNRNTPRQRVSQERLQKPAMFGPSRPALRA